MENNTINKFNMLLTELGINPSKYNFTEKQIVDTAWVNVLASHNELMLFCNSDNIDTVIEKVNCFQKGRIKNIFNYIKKDKVHLEYSKDMGFIIRQIDSKIQYKNRKWLPVYIECNIMDKYLLGIVEEAETKSVVTREDCIDSVKKLASECGITVFLTQFFPYIQIAPLSEEKWKRYGISELKQLVNDNRTTKNIAPLIEKEKIKLHKIINITASARKEKRHMNFPKKCLVRFLNMVWAGCQKISQA